MFDRTAIAWAICRAATPENLQELSTYGNAGPIADAVISAIIEGMHADGVSNEPLNATPKAPATDAGEVWAWGWYERGGEKRAYGYLPTVDYPREPECEPFPLYRIPPAPNDDLRAALEAALRAPDWPTSLGHVHAALAALKENRRG